MSLAQHDSSNEYAFETEIFQFTYDQFISLRGAALATSIISLASSSSIMIAYTYMLIYHRKEANRVSLKCVFLCCLADALNAIWNIIIVGVKGGSAFCQAASILIEFSNMLNACLLTLVGINLFLIFVLNVARRDLLEKFYYPSVILYALVGESVSIYTEVVTESAGSNQYSCWHQIYIADRRHDTFSWMWFYGFIFFVNVIAIFCSVAAMIKLLHEQRELAKKMNNIALSSSFTDLHTDENIESSVKKRHSYVFSTVVVRCILYPLVPFLVNIFGLILQLVITVNPTHTPGFPLSMLDVVFSNIGGFFVAVVFFTDPAITSVIRDAYDGWREKYIDQYTLVPKEDVEKYILVTAPTAPCSPTTEATYTSMSPLEFATTTDNDNAPIFIQSPSLALITQSNRYSGSNSDLYHSYGNGVNSNDNENSSNETLTTIHQKSSNKDTIPMRRILIQTPQFNSHTKRKSNNSNTNNRRRSSSIILGSISTLAPALTRNSQIPELQVRMSKNIKEIYIPYRFPRLAKCVNSLLGLVGAKGSSSTATTTLSRKAIRKNSDDSTSYSSEDGEEDIMIPSNNKLDITTPIKEEDSKTTTSQRTI